MKLLTIAIPTYNRSPYLRELLESIYLFMPPGEDVNVYVSDNASTDDTKSILREYAKRYPDSFSFDLASCNRGADANYLRCLTTPTSQYIWLVGSDDLLHDNSISLVVKSLRQPACADIHLFSRYNFYNGSLSFKKQSFCRDCCLDKSFSMAALNTAQGLRFFYDNALDIGASFTYISSCVVSSAKAKDVVSETHLRFEGSAYLHVEIFFIMLSSGSVLSVHSSAPVLNRCGNDSFCSGDRSKRRLIDYKLTAIARYAFGHHTSLYRSYCCLIARQFLSPPIAIGDQSRALRDGGSESLLTLNSKRSAAFADQGVLLIISKLYSIFFPPVVLKLLFRFRFNKVMKT